MAIRSIESNFLGNQTLQFRVLSEGQMEKILSSAFELLERTGVEVHSEEAVSLLKKAGCYVDGTRVRIPSFVIKKALGTVPSRVVLCDREGKRKMFLEGNNSYFGPGPTCPNFIDAETGVRRKTLKQDVVNTAKVTDDLPNIDFVMSLSMISDCTPVLADVHEVHAMLQNTTKPIVSWAFNTACLQDIIDMCTFVAGGLEHLQRNPFLVIYSEPTTPLSHSKEALEKLMLMNENNLPALYTPGMIMGGTAPVTIAGTLVVGVADNLVGLVVSQLKREGAPFIAGVPGGPMDMNTMQHCYGAPEFVLEQAASTEIYRYLRIPTWGTAGAADSKITDQQAAIEATLQILTGALSGANLIHDVGFTDLGMTGSLDQLVMCDEIIGMVRRMMVGVEVNQDTLAVDVLDEVGPGAQFLGVEHTFKHFRERVWYPTLIDRRSYSDWERDGKKTMGERVREKVKNILSTHSPKLLPERTVKVLDQIVEKAEGRVRK